MNGQTRGLFGGHLIFCSGIPSLQGSGKLTCPHWSLAGWSKDKVGSGSLSHSGLIPSSSRAISCPTPGTVHRPSPAVTRQSLFFPSYPPPPSSITRALAQHRAFPNVVPLLLFCQRSSFFMHLTLWVTLAHKALYRQQWGFPVCGFSGGKKSGQKCPVFLGKRRLKVAIDCGTCFEKCGLKGFGGQKETPVQKLEGLKEFHWEI